MKITRVAKRSAAKAPAFDVEAFLQSTGPPQLVVSYQRGETIFEQGDPALSVLFIQSGGIKLTVASKAGKEAVIAILGPGDFFGEACLTQQPLRVASATAVTIAAVVQIPTKTMIALLHRHQGMADRFMAHLLGRNIRIEEDLIDQLFNSSEKRLARALLILAGYGKDGKPLLIVPHISQETLAEMIGTTRSRVNFFLNKFRKQGFIDYNGELKINSSLLTVILKD